MKTPESKHSNLTPWITLLAVWLAWTPGGWAQAEQEEEGMTAGGYYIRQSIEFGGRIVDFSGNGASWNTFVNLHDGPRLLEQSLDMRAVEGTGLIFDHLSTSSFGYGGDPNNVTRLRISKAKWYEFSGSFRRDRNFWDYNLLANPLNPQVPDPAFPADTRVLTSPHRFETVRRMTDLNLTLAPLSPVRVRLGYQRNRHEGPSFSTFHEGTDILIFQDWDTTNDAFRAGVDLNILPRTTLSFDQFYSRFRGDTSWVDRNFNYQLADGTPVDLGLPFNPVGRTPCQTPLIDTTTDPPTVNPICNAYLGYERFAPARYSYPTEQLSFQSSYFQRVNFTGRVSYSSADLDSTIDEEFRARVSRTNQAQVVVLGPVDGNRAFVNADLAVTAMLTDRVRMVNTLRWSDQRLPAAFDMTERSLFATTLDQAPVVFDAAACAADPAACPPHTNSSPADIALERFNNFLGHQYFLNTLQLEVRLAKQLSGRIGYRFRDREVTLRRGLTADFTYFPSNVRRGLCADPLIPLEPDGTCRVQEEALHTHDHQTREHSLLLGAVARPTPDVRVNFDLELMSANFEDFVRATENIRQESGLVVSEEEEQFNSRNAFTRISPRNLQRYRLRASYRPQPWMTLAGSMNFLEARNNVPEVNHRRHNRNAGVSATFAPHDRFALDLSFNHQDVFSTADVCFVATPAPAHATACAAAPAFLFGRSTYDQTTDFFSGTVMFRPVRRVQANLGYTVSNVDGRAPILADDGTELLINEGVPPGPLRLTYHLPTAWIGIDLHKNLTWKTGWNYYGYNEQSPAGPTRERDTRGNVFTLGLRYAF